jgi:hypothetical protein
MLVSEAWVGLHAPPGFNKEQKSQREGSIPTLQHSYITGASMDFRTFTPSHFRTA